MKPPLPEDTSLPIDALVELARRQPARYTRPALDAGLESLTLRLERGRAKRQRVTRVAALAAVLLSGAFFALAGHWLLKGPEPLTYEVQDGVILDGGYLRGTGGSGVVVTFEEGTTVTLTPSARARLRSVSAGGARLGLESGAASFAVTPDANRRWEVEVGPFLVQVKGTVFDVAWDPRAEQFQLDLKHGKVSVSGPVSGGEITLQGGQRLVVELSKGETTISEPRDVSHPSEAPSASPSTTDDAALRLEPSLAAPSSALTLSDATEGRQITAGVEERHARQTPRDWAAALARGQWDKILRDADGMGLETVLGDASSEELFALSSAARYRHRTGLARDALLAIKRRFPNSARSLDATFLLGRVAESRGETRSAEEWYDAYLSGAPNGAYAAEALGRKMALQGRIFGAARARPLAQEYLRRFPKGSYAGSARVLLESP